MASILIVEDEERIASFVAKGLRADGHRTAVVGDGRVGPVSRQLFALFARHVHGMSNAA